MLLKPTTDKNYEVCHYTNMLSELQSDQKYVGLKTLNLAWWGDWVMVIASEQYSFILWKKTDYSYDRVLLLQLLSLNMFKVMEVTCLCTEPTHITHRVRIVLNGPFKCKTCKCAARTGLKYGWVSIMNILAHKVNVR